MKTFKVWLKENNHAMFSKLTAGVGKKVLEQPSFTALKNIAKNSKYQSVRFTISGIDGKLSAGDSEHVLHHMLVPIPHPKDIRGFITHHNGEYHTNILPKPKHDHEELQQHPIFQRMQRHGIRYDKEDAVDA